MTRNGTPPWPGTDDVEHEYCTHDAVTRLMPLLHSGSIECQDCYRIVYVADLTAVPYRQHIGRTAA